MQEQFLTEFVPTQAEQNKFLCRTYLWMGIALFISAASAFFTASSETLMNLLFFASKGRGFMVLAIAELVLVFIFSLKIQTLSVGLATILYAAYSVINGMTLSSIFYVYELGSIAYCFAASALMFILMSVYGFLTKTDLSKAGHYLMMALLGLLIVSAVNMLITWITKTSLPMISWLISIASIVIFTGLTAYDTQKILRTAQRATDSDDYKKIALLGALELYLDFINIFLNLLKLFGKRK